MGKLARNLRICGDCGIAYTSVSLTKYIDQCPICKSRRFEAIVVKGLEEPEFGICGDGTKLIDGVCTIIEKTVQKPWWQFW